MLQLSVLLTDDSVLLDEVPVLLIQLLDLLGQKLGSLALVIFKLSRDRHVSLDDSLLGQSQQAVISVPLFLHLLLGFQSSVARVLALSDQLGPFTIDDLVTILVLIYLLLECDHLGRLLLKHELSMPGVTTFAVQETVTLLLSLQEHLLEGLNLPFVLEYFRGQFAIS